MRASVRLEIPTPVGPAWVDLNEAEPNQAETRGTGRRSTRTPWAALVLGHGAGGSVDAPDLLAVTSRAVGAGVSVARVTQPYRVAGRRAPAPAPRLDEAWRAVLDALSRRRAWRGLPMVHGGRSSGARVACRCAHATGAAGVVALAFPTHPPGRPDRSREDELRAVRCPLLVVQGTRDAFGQPGTGLFDGADRVLVSLDGADHSLRAGAGAAADAVLAFLDRYRPAPPHGRPNGER